MEMKAKIWKRGASARKAKEVMELQKLEEEKAAKARRRSVEAAELNALISQKLERRHSHDGTISQNEDGQLTPNGSSKGRRKSITGKPITGEAISRKGQFDPKEVDLINKYVKKRDGEMAERRESIRRSSLDAEAIATAARRALAELDLEENDEEEPRPPQEERPSTGSTTSDQSTSTGIIPPPSAARPRARRKSAERMAEIQREAQRRVEAAYQDGNNSEGRAPGEAEAKPAPTASQIGAARAAAKMAGGIFYTLDEHGAVLERLRSLEREADALREENASLTAMAAAQVVQGSPTGQRKKRSSFSKDALSRPRDRSPASRAPAAPPPTEREREAKPFQLRGEPIDIAAGLDGKQPDYVASAPAELEVQVERDRSGGTSGHGGSAYRGSSGHGGSAYRVARISGSGARMLTAVAAATARAVSNLDSSFKGATGAGSREPTPTVVRPPSSLGFPPHSWTAPTSA